MVVSYFEIGRMIIEEEQNGKERAAYGKQLITELSKKLMVNFGRGFSQRNLEQMRQFYLVYSIPQTVSSEFENADILHNNFQLSWSHYLELMRIDDIYERKFYEIESKKKPALKYKYKFMNYYTITRLFSLLLYNQRCPDNN